MIQRRALCLALPAFFTIAGSSPLEATCWGDPDRTLCEAYADAAVVFVGRVMKLDEAPVVTEAPNERRVGHHRLTHISVLEQIAGESLPLDVVASRGVNLVDVEKRTP